MRLLDAARARLRLLLSRRAAEERMREEIGFHVDMEAARIAREEGVAPDEARRRALVAFGGVERYKEELRAGRGLAWVGGMGLDFTLGLRMLAKSPGLTLVGVLGMAVAIAIGAVSFGTIYSFIGATLPVPHGERVVSIENVDTRWALEGRHTHLHDLPVWREGLRAVEEIGAYRIIGRNVISRDVPPTPMRVAEMTASGFRIAGVAPLLGRYLADDDERAGAPPVVVIGYEVWQQRFAGAADVVGRTVRLGSAEHTVVGVMPAGFGFPHNNRVWTPLRLDPARFARGEAPPLHVFGRLTAGATLEDARAQAATIGRQLAADHPATHGQIRPRVVPYAYSFFDSPEVIWALHLVQFLVSLLLVVIGTNVATLVYARTASRMGEISVRTALGASRGRIVAQLFAEALVLSGVAAAVGLAGASFALWHIRVHARRLAGEQLPFWIDFGLTPGLVLYVAGLAVLGAVIVGVLPALEATRQRVQENLRHLGTGGSGMRLGRTWTVLIVSQVAAAVALLPVVLYVTLVQQRHAGPESRVFPTKEFLAAPLVLDREPCGAEAGREAPRGALQGCGPGTRAREAYEAEYAARYARLRAELVRRLEAEPGVSAVVVMSAVPGDEPGVRVEVEDGASGVHAVGVALVNPGYFGAFDVPLLAGRPFQTQDLIDGGTDCDARGVCPALARASGAVIVNQSFVRKVLGGGPPLGRQIRRAAPDDGGDDSRAARPGPWLEIVGVVADFPEGSGADDLSPRVYEPLLPGASPSGVRRTVVRRALAGANAVVPAGDQHPLLLAVRVKGAAPATLTNRVREIAVAVDPMLRLQNVRPLTELLSFQKVENRIVYTAVSLVTLSVLLLSAAGIYALISFRIALRRRDIGIRAAAGRS
jgi:putative ABC transport system permease protein